MTLSEKALFSTPDWSQYDQGMAYDELRMKLCDLINSQTDFITCDHASVDNLIIALKALIVPNQETVKLIEQLKRAGMSIYGLTNMPKEIYDHLVKYPIFKDFAGIVSSSYLGLAKPDMPIYKRLLNDYQLAANQTVFIDDRAVNLVKADELGMKTILFTNAEQARNVFNQELCLNLSQYKQVEAVTFSM